MLKDLDIQSRIEAVHVEATGPGAGIFLFAEYEHSLGGFTAYGRKGLPSEQVAEMACNDLLCALSKWRGDGYAPGRSVDFARRARRGPIALDDVPGHVCIY